MQRTRPNSPNPAPAADPVTSFNVVIAYDNLDSGKRAKRTYDFLVEQLGAENKFTNQMWKFDLMDLPHLQPIALQDALGADILIVACRGDQELPQPVKEWVDSWASGRPQAMVLVTLFDVANGDLPTARSTRAYLAGVALRNGMGFFSQPGGEDSDPHHDNGRTPAGLLESNPKTGGRSQAPSRVVDLAGSSRWGINE